jgi:hypothetical protein
MRTKFAGAVLSVLLLASCATTTPPPRFSAVSPADADASEAATPPAPPALAGEAGHEGHSMPAAPDAADPTDEVYACPMHPEVMQSSPGSCTKCGMQLVKRAGARPRP